MESRKMIQMNLFAKQKQRHRHREQRYGHQDVGVRGDRMNWEIRIDIYTLLLLLLLLSHFSLV